jgi:hypothetical protein
VIIDFLRTGEWNMFSGLNVHIIQREALFYSIQFPNIENLSNMLLMANPQTTKLTNSQQSTKGDLENDSSEMKRSDSFKDLPDTLAIFQLKWIGKNQDCPILYFLTKSNSKAIAIAHAKHKANQIFLKQLEGHKLRGWQIIHIETKQINTSTYDSFNAYLIKPPTSFLPYNSFSSFPLNDPNQINSLLLNQIKEVKNSVKEDPISQQLNNNNNQNLRITSNNLDNIIEKEVDLDKDQFEDF